jgi:hypothetical protein
MRKGIVIEIVPSKYAPDCPRTAGVARLWVGESEKGQIQIAFDAPGADLTLTAPATRVVTNVHH